MYIFGPIYKNTIYLFVFSSPTIVLRRVQEIGRLAEVSRATPLHVAYLE